MEFNHVMEFFIPKATCSSSLLQSSVSYDPLKIILYWCVTQYIFPININVKIRAATTNR